jgi:non-heme chloroperoxidase
MSFIKVGQENSAGIKADRPVAMMELLKNFYSADGADGKLVSERVMQAN